MNIQDQYHYAKLQARTRRHFLREGITGLGAMWLALQNELPAIASDTAVPHDPARPLKPRQPYFAARAKRVIMLHMAGGPSQLELFEYKPELSKFNGKPCPEEYLKGQRFAFIKGVPKMMGTIYPFHQAGEAGFWISDRLPHFEKVLDQVTFIRTMKTDQFNHAPAQLLFYSGNPNLGHASMGSWVTYGLGSENQNLPGFVVLVSGGRNPSAGKSLWGSGFLPSVYQGVQCRTEGDPVLYLSNPEGIDRQMQRRIVDAISDINRDSYREFGDPETVTRIAQYEMAFNMQMAATDVFDLKQESKDTHELYGVELGKESFANNCLLARRLSERGVRFVQLFDWGWDSHGSAESEALNVGFKKKCEQADKALYALLTDLKQRGMLEDTLVAFVSEFGRTPMRENRGNKDAPFAGRDHHPHAYTIWLAGGGVRRGFSYGETDPIGYSPLTEPVLTRDLQATILHLLGIDFEKQTYFYQGLNQKLTGVKPARVVKEILA